MPEDRELTTEDRVALAVQYQRQNGGDWPTAMRWALNYKPGGTGLAAYRQKVELERAMARREGATTARERLEPQNEGARRLNARGEGARRLGGDV
jgi:hypothetical protein